MLQHSIADVASVQLVLEAVRQRRHGPVVVIARWRDLLVELVVIFEARTGLMLFALSYACAGPLALGFLLFTAVFTLVLYTLIYREAAKLAP